jgi:hypothetical protein
VPLCPPQITHGLTQDRTRASASQAVTRWFFTSETSFESRVTSSRICGRRSNTGRYFFTSFFGLLLTIPPLFHTHRLPPLRILRLPGTLSIIKFSAFKSWAPFLIRQFVGHTVRNLNLTQTSHCAMYLGTCAGHRNVLKLHALYFKIPPQRHEPTTYIVHNRRIREGYVSHSNFGTTNISS